MTMLPTYFPSPSQGVWHLGPLPIRAYALFIIAGIVVALVIGDRRWVARGGQRGVIYDIALWAVPFGLIGGRLYHLATDWRTYFGPGGAGPAAALRIWDGGLGIWGAVALGAVGAWVACRRRGIPLPAFADAVAPGIILAQAIGRLGNYFNQELYGRETTLPWGLEIFYRRDPAGYIDPHSLDGVSTGQLALVVQPTFLYELIWNVLVFVALIYLDRRFSLGHGRLFAIYVAGYCVGRFCVELLRDDTATHIAGIRINSFTSTFVFIGAVVYLVLAPKGREDPASLRGTEYVDEELPEAEPEPADELAAVASASGAASGAAADAETTELEKATESKAAESKDREDEAVETEAVEAEVAEPETVKTQAEPEGPGDEEAEVEVEESEVEEEAEKEAEPEPAEAEEPEAVADESESAEPEVAEAEAAVAEAMEAERAEPDDAEAEAVVTEAAEAEAEEPEAEELEAEEPEAEELEAEEPEAEEPEAEEPEAETEEAEAETETEIDEVETEADEPEADEPEAEDAEAEEPKSEEPQAESESAEPVAEDRGEPGEPASPAPADAGTAAKAESGSTRRRLRFRLRNRRDR
ncbi:prolipoprotein diacylglyceryl transferase [Mycobacterium sp. IS-836]|uniref:prolipoprotein diacylglyceryl transferase n=1 Tax=Mycobacterium sp. IS-836 TaxID=1834160 RepID=UPI00096DD2B0|nr:prolipoprotein diacylglyceryl transferase [Mycobacterium sp. IS-836]OMC56485.1 prolipoprotein diacylglyceryl transferase [Mycobacterium sp. IS-836]